MKATTCDNAYANAPTCCRSFTRKMNAIEAATCPLDNEFDVVVAGCLRIKLSPAFAGVFSG